MLSEVVFDEDIIEVVWLRVVVYCPWTPNKQANMIKASKAGKNLEIFMEYTPTAN
jgi:hypothetical protein